MSTPANQQYSTQPNGHTPHSGLPFTGFDTGILVAPAIILCIVGFVLRHFNPKAR